MYPDLVQAEKAGGEPTELSGGTDAGEPEAVGFVRQD